MVRVLLEQVVVAALGGLLQSRKQFMTMVLIGKGFLMLLDCLAHHVKNAQASDFAAGTGKVAVDELLIQAKNFKDLGAAVTHVS